MKTKRSVMGLATVVLILTTTTAAQAQGTVTFNYPWAVNGIGYSPLYYFDSISFRTIPFPQPQDNMAHVGVGLAGHPNDDTPHLEFINTVGTPQSVVFAWTDAASQGHTFTDGAPFGLVSVDLADPVAPSTSPVAITFNGFRGDGSMVSQTFTTPGSGSSFQTYYFDPDFASGLVRVEMPSSFWAMDNIAWVPEPGTYALFGLGLLAFAARRFHQRRKLCVERQPMA